MKKRSITLLAKYCVMLIPFCLPVTVSADILQGKVISIADGDTVTVLDATNAQYRIRLQGIDAPERSQAFGNVSKEHLADLEQIPIACRGRRLRPAPESSKTNLGRPPQGRPYTQSVIRSGVWETSHCSI